MAASFIKPEEQEDIRRDKEIMAEVQDFEERLRNSGKINPGETGIQGPDADDPVRYLNCISINEFISLLSTIDIH